MLPVTSAVCLALVISSIWNAGFRFETISGWHLVLWLLYWCVTLGTIIYAIDRWRFAPIATTASTFLALMLLPFDYLSHMLEFRRNQAAREAIVRGVEQGRIVPVSPATGLILHAPRRTIGSHEIALLEVDQKPAVFFVIYESSDQYEGWLYVPAGADPAHCPHRGRRYAEHWYYVPN